jgi:ribosome-binding protein aMBF1 (putative translation factor)
MKPDITPSQIREARALLGWSRDRLAAFAELPPNAVVRTERGDAGVPLVVLSSIRFALEAAGVVFVDENVDGPGVRLRNA